MSADKAYSPEPWSIGEVIDDRSTTVGRSIMSGDTLIGAAFYHMRQGAIESGVDGYRTSPSEEVGINNQERIVACVNACKGMPTKRLISGEVTIVHDMAKNYEEQQYILTGPKEFLISEAIRILREEGYEVKSNVPE